MKIAIIDYNAGNIASIANALERFGFGYVVTRDPKIILAADKVIFPGQGRAGSAMRNLREVGLDSIITKITKPFLGVCLGMQLQFESSEEDDTPCLGIIEGRSVKFDEQGLKVPQIGWNTVTQKVYDPLFRNIPDVFYAYFVNSYYVKSSNNVLANSNYGTPAFASIVRKDNFYGLQFHPEKSGEIGLQILKNFCELGTERNETLVIPAIDLIDGECVRLRRGNYHEQTTYGNDPVAIARAFVGNGAKYLHVVDLDGAKSGKPQNIETVVQIAKVAGVPIQVGGGIRTIEQARMYLASGIDRVVVSTSALNDTKMIRAIVAEYGPGRIAVSVDVKNGIVATKGWQDVSSIPPEVFLDRLAELGITTVIYTDIEKDGTLEGPNFAAIKQMLSRSFRFIVAGGIRTLEDIKKLNDMGVYGVIIGKALYEKNVDLKDVGSTISSPIVAGSRVAPARSVTKRVIACMDIADGRVVKGINFKNVRDAGDPVELGKRYSDQGVDELVFLDINATVENRRTLYELVSRIANKINIPFTVGGGVKTIADIKNLLNAGADKVSIGSAAVTNPDFVRQAAQEFGSQCIVISVDPKKKGDSSEIYIKGGREATGVDAIQFCKDMETKGAGELLVNSLDRDGTKKGYDLELLRTLADAVSIPVIASSGAGTKEHFLEALGEGYADAVLAASVFHSDEIKIPELKEYFTKNGIAIRV